MADVTKASRQLSVLGDMDSVFWIYFYVGISLEVNQQPIGAANETEQQHFSFTLRPMPYS